MAGLMDVKHDLKTVAKAYLDEYLPETCGIIRADSLPISSFGVPDKRPAWS